MIYYEFFLHILTLTLSSSPVFFLCSSFLIKIGDNDYFQACYHLLNNVFKETVGNIVHICLQDDKQLSKRVHDGLSEVPCLIPATM